MIIQTILSREDNGQLRPNRSTTFHRFPISDKSISKQTKQLCEPSMNIYQSRVMVRLTSLCPASESEKISVRPFFASAIQVHFYAFRFWPLPPDIFSRALPSFLPSNLHPPMLKKMGGIGKNHHWFSLVLKSQ